MDGRDIGTVVLPNATVKIFLTATPEARAERRYKELLMKGEKHGYQNVLADVARVTIRIPTVQQPRCARPKTLCWWIPAS